MNTNTVELQMLFCTLALGVVQLLIAVLAGVTTRGMPWAAGPRDAPGAPLGKIAGRLDRAYWNFLETFPFFAAAVLLMHALDKSTATSVLGAQIYVWARLLYIPAYVIGVPFVRTLIWVASFAGILMVMSAYWPG
jgi:uncharacterized MAPEG superfamily protein